MPVVKIKGLEVSYTCWEVESWKSVGDPNEDRPDDIELGAIEKVHSDCVTKAWGNIVDALKKTGEDTSDLPEIISEWASDFKLGDRSKKLDTLARKKAKEYVEETLRQQRYPITEAKQNGFIDRSVEEMFQNGDSERFYEEAREELDPKDLLDPLPVTSEELKGMKEKKHRGSAVFIADADIQECNLISCEEVKGEEEP